MAATNRTKEAPSYSPASFPLLDGGADKYLQGELRTLKGILDTYRLMLPQSSTKAPATLIDGMCRLSRDPWRPAAGQTADAWVYWDAAGEVWRLQGATPTNT